MDAPASTTPDTGTNSKAHLFWPGLVFALLGAQLVLVIVAIYLSTSDPSVVVEPNYYQQALHWDEHVAQLRTNAALGWSLTIDVAPTADLRGQRELTATLLNRDGTPLDGATITITLFHHARGHARTGLKLTAASAGRYVALGPLRRAGLWQFRCTVQRGPDTFTAVIDQDVSAAPGGA